ncbi:MAG: hypothetical protein AUJ75_02600 [Candidatus Omnitrophica bacterium CG1_02_49_10]|nr:MAG: hypothetical protein AUJ75_02600 [Candidatus Omnitrophica bacterium CG1_02_49_10]
MEEKEIGTIEHYFNKISVGIIKLSGALKVGDIVHIKGHTSDITQNVDSMEVEHRSVEEAKAGDAVGIKVSDTVHEHDKVYKVIG